MEPTPHSTLRCPGTRGRTLPRRGMDTTLRSQRTIPRVRSNVRPILRYFISPPLSHSWCTTAGKLVHCDSINNERLGMRNLYAGYISCPQPTTTVVVVQPKPTVTTTVVTPGGDYYYTASLVLTFVCLFFGTWLALFCTIPAMFVALSVSA